MKKAASYRLDEQTYSTIKALAENYGCSQADVIENAVHLLEEVWTQAEELASARNGYEHTPTMSAIMREVYRRDVELVERQSLV